MTSRCNAGIQVQERRTIKLNALRNSELLIRSKSITPENTLIELRINATETALQSQVKSLGNRWDAEKKLWIVPYCLHQRDKAEKVYRCRNQATGQIVTWFIDIET